MVSRCETNQRGFSRLRPSSEHSFWPYSNLFERASRLICKSCRRQCCSSIAYYMPFCIGKPAMLRSKCNGRMSEQHDFIMRQVFVDTLVVSVTSRWASIHENARASSLIVQQSRMAEKFQNIVTSNNECDTQLNLDRLAHSKIDGPAVTLAYMADDKSYVSSSQWHQHSSIWMLT